MASPPNEPPSTLDGHTLAYSDRGSACVEGRFDDQATNRWEATCGAVCCYSVKLRCDQPLPGGRPFFAHGRLRTARATKRSDWAAGDFDDLAAARPKSARRALASRWTRIAAEEHASIAAFARSSIALLELGAPPELLSATHDAARDEIEHARIAYAIASAYAGTNVGPAKLALDGVRFRGVTAAEFARDTCRGGCLGETAASLVTSQCARDCIDEGVASALARIAREEEAHAELAWRTLAWLVRAYGGEVIPALLDERARLVSSRLADCNGRREPLARYGVASRRQKRAIAERATRKIILPCLDALIPANVTSSPRRN